VWVAAVVMGIVALERYKATPGLSAAAASQWPAGSELPAPTPERATLLLFAHPKCPCTRATLSEFERLVAHVGSSIDARVVFVRPPGVPARWERTDLWNAAVKIPGVSVHVDDGGAEATRLGVMTSGQVLLYDRGGALRFAGGITASRGHAGDNPGRSAVENHLAGRPDALTTTPVFGCPLLAPSSCEEDETCPR
jgi:hypothetical protein